MILLRAVHWISVLLAVGRSVDARKHIAAVWMDDGHGHTIKAELPPSDAKLLKMHMMDILGLGLPSHRHRHHRKAAGSAPNFLKEIYDALDERGQAPHFDPQYRATVGAANTIITFVNRVSHIHKPHGSNRQLYFDVSDVPLTYSLIGAELRIHRKVVKKQQNKDLFLHIYGDATDNGKEVILATAKIPEEGWLSINVTEEILSSIISTGPSVRLRMAVTSYSRKHEISLHEVGITGVHGAANFRPFLIGFFTRPDIEAAKSRTIRAVHPKTDYKNPYLAASITHIPSDEPEPLPETQCQKRPLHVSFKDLGWEEWVIAPEGYDANFCEGRCQFPILSNMNATNHAIIQTLVKMKNAVSEGDQLPPDACCAPKDLTTISVLYYDYSSNVVLKKYPKMIVKTCGCF